MEEVIRCRHANSSLNQAIATERQQKIPDPLTSRVEKVDKVTAVQQHTSRFNLN